MQAVAKIARMVGMVSLAVLTAVGASAESAALSDAQIRERLIAESRAQYSGNCPCPYDTDRAGRPCGKRSAHSRPGAAAPLCYEGDVTQAMVDAYRARATKH